MDRNDLVIDFSNRLTQLMQHAGFGSLRSKTGVTVKCLAEVSGCSHQMARKYVLGGALPDVDVILKIAKWLKVSPGWLLFGEDSKIPNNIHRKYLVHIEPDLLEYILLNSLPLLSITRDKHELVCFIMDMIQDATHIEAEKTDILKLIDISIHSAMRFNDPVNKGREKIG